MTSRKGFTREGLEAQLNSDAEFAKYFKEAVNEGIGEALKQARKAAGLNQKEVAERMGVSEARVTQLEGTTGNSITLRSLRRFATAVGCRLDISFVNPHDTTVVSRLFVVDDRAPEPLQLDIQDRSSIAAALAEALTHSHTFTCMPDAAPYHASAFKYLTALKPRQSSAVQMTGVRQPVWEPSGSREQYVGAGV